MQKEEEKKMKKEMKKKKKETLKSESVFRDLSIFYLTTMFLC